MDNPHEGQSHSEDRDGDASRKDQIAGEQQAVSIMASSSPNDTQRPAMPLTDKALRFLSTASNETLGACVVGLSTVTYIILGRVGLLLIGIAGGIVLHATWEESVHANVRGSTMSEKRRRREHSSEIITRVLNWRFKESCAENGTDDARSSSQAQLFGAKRLDYSDFRPKTAAALNDLTDAVVRDYVKWWYSPIIPDETAFPSAARDTLAAFVVSLSSHLSRKRPADTFLDFVTNSSSIIIIFLQELSSALVASASAAPSAAVEAYLELKPSSSLANIMDEKQQEKKFRMIAEDILQNYLESKAYDCVPVRIFFREILARVVLEMALQTCSKPEWINQWIVYLLEEGEPEIMNVIDAGVEGATGSGIHGSANSETVQAASSPCPHERVGAESPSDHERVVTRAQDAMEEAMQEAKRLTQMIAEEDARKLREQCGEQGQEQDQEQGQEQGQEHTLSTSQCDDVSDVTTPGMPTPASSQSEQEKESEHGLTRKASGASAQASSAYTGSPPAKPSFTSFDQLISSQQPTALGNTQEKPAKETTPLTLFGANISILDDSAPGDNGPIRSKPTGDYLVQIEPASSQHPGWMIARKFIDFETLHEVLRRISKVSGVAGFSEAHPSLPAWKGHTKTSLRGELERYMNDAVRFQPLAESEGMKRFLEKDNGFTRTPSTPKNSFSGVGWPTSTAFENMGKGMFDALTKAPKEVAGGGKALFGGVTGAFGVLGPRKTNSVSSAKVSSSETPAPPAGHRRAESTIAPLSQVRKSQDSLASSLASGNRRTDSTIAPLTPARRSQDSVRSLSIVDTQPAREPQMERRPSWNPDVEADMKRPGSSKSSAHGRSSRDHSRANSRAPSFRESFELSLGYGGDQILELPPLPSEIADDYDSNGPWSPARQRRHNGDSDSDFQSPKRPPLPERSTHISTVSVSSTKPLPKPKPPLSEQETQVTIELLFAVITELYSLSSAWQIRKTLLQAAKSFLIRPGNPQLDSIRQLIQSTVLDDNTSDEGIATHISKLRQNVLPTKEELKRWPQPLSDEEKEALRVKARKLLVERGMPMALTSVMGSAASGEALGKVFDCLQIERVTRGLMFGLLLQSVRAMTQ